MVHNNGNSIVAAHYCIHVRVVPSRYEKKFILFAASRFFVKLHFVFTTQTFPSSSLQTIHHWVQLLDPYSMKYPQLDKKFLTFIESEVS
jgi:hypothetical protein